METHVEQIRTYLPVKFQEEEINEFLEYLISAYVQNLEVEKYQFSFTAFHMLYMSFIYKSHWFLKLIGNTDIETFLQEEIKSKRATAFNTLFDLSQANEKTSLEKLMLTLSFHVNDIGICKNLVEVRNNCSHASGKIYYKNASQIEHFILEEMANVKAIQKKLRPHLTQLLDKFIDSYYRKNWIDSDLDEWIFENYLSQKDIEEMLLHKPAFLRLSSNNADVFLKKILYAALVSTLARYLDDKGEYFSKSLVALMKGLPPEINMQTDPSDSPKMKATQEIIEEKLVPTLIFLEADESAKAQKILNLTTA